MKSERPHEMTFENDDSSPTKQDPGEGLHEYPALDDEPGYLVEKRAEFKRLLAKNWRESYVTEVICLNIAIWIILIIGHFLFG